MQSSDTSWYSDLEATLTKTFANHSQVRAAYTWSKTLDGDGANPVEASSATPQAIGNQYQRRGRYGPAAFSRPQRLVVSYLYELPIFRNGAGLVHSVLGGWQISGVTTIQSGNPLTLTGTNSSNITGTTSDRAQMASGCSAGDLRKAGSVQSKISSFFNTSCVGPTVPYKVIGSDGRATDFGNSGVGVDDPVGRNTGVACVAAEPA